jgi:hypothetical protein
MSKFVFVGIVMIGLMYGCGGTTGGAKTVESGKQETVVGIASNTSAVSVSKRIEYGADSNVPEKVRAECSLQSQLPEYIHSFASEYNLPVALKDGDVSSKDKGKVLSIEFSNVVGAGGGAWSGAKFVVVTGELFENGKKIGNFTGRRTSGGGFFGAYKGTCSILGRCVKALGKDIALWLANPTMDARLGEF